MRPPPSESAFAREKVFAPARCVLRDCHCAISGPGLCFLREHADRDIEQVSEDEGGVHAQMFTEDRRDDALSSLSSASPSGRGPV